jgi:hypothetical protein
MAHQIHASYLHIYGTINYIRNINPFSKYLAAQLSQKLQLPYVYNVKDSIKLIHNLEKLQIDGNTRLYSFDVENMYTNIPVNEIENIIIEILNNDNETPTTEKQELGTLLNTILEHNCMQFNDQFYNQNEGLGMGAPTSAIHMTTYPITQENKVLELNTINEILSNNHDRQRINSMALNQHSSPKTPRNAKIKK